MGTEAGKGYIIAKKMQRGEKEERYVSVRMAKLCLKKHGKTAKRADAHRIE